MNKVQTKCGNMPDFRLELEERPSAADAQRLYNGVRAFNRAQTGCDRPRSAAYFLRDERDQIIGGVQGTLWGRSMHIDVLWIDENYRGSGGGSKLMQAIERYGAARGHPLVYLETTSFQALPFYESIGYRVFGKLPGISDGHTLFFLKKEVGMPGGGAGETQVTDSGHAK